MVKTKRSLMIYRLSIRQPLFFQLASALTCFIYRMCRLLACFYLFYLAVAVNLGYLAIPGCWFESISLVGFIWVFHDLPSNVLLPSSPSTCLLLLTGSDVALFTSCHIAMSTTSNSTSRSGKRKKSAKKSDFHESQSIAFTTNIVEDDDDAPFVKKRTVYIAEPDFDPVEDTDTLARAAQLDGFTYLLGESVFPEDTSDDDLNTLSGLRVQVQHTRKAYASTVSIFLWFSCLNLLMLST